MPRLRLSSGRWLPVDASIRDPGARVRSFLDGLLGQALSPGLQYTVVDRTGPLLTYAGGWADLRTRMPMSPATTLMAYSMSKTITAAAVLRLAATGYVGLDDPLQRYVDNPYGSGVTVRRLLSHTAGLPNPIPLAWVHLAADHPRFEERRALAEAVRKNGRLSSKPGRRFRYSNLGYWLLGPLVERVSGMPFSTYVEREVLAPLGIAPQSLGYAIVDPAQHGSGYLEKWSLLNLVKRLVVDSAYIDHYEGPWLRIHSHYLNGPAFGGLIGTASGRGKGACAGWSPLRS